MQFVGETDCIFLYGRNVFFVFVWNNKGKRGGGIEDILESVIETHTMSGCLRRSVVPSD